MTRLHSEWLRLYLPCPRAHTDGHVPVESRLIDEAGQVRAMVLAVGKPADWTSLSAAWRGVQADLALPAPGIAVSGIDGFQLWFSLAEAVPVDEAHAFLRALRDRYLGQLAPARTTLLPDLDAGASAAAWHAGMLPPSQVRPDQWSAFVAHDLAPVFADTPWLDMPPSPEGQADLLSSLRSITPDDWRLALGRLGPVDDGQPQAPGSAMRPASATPSPSAEPAAVPSDDPRRFLLKVMNDDTVPLALRIEAAKALLPHGGT